MCYINQLDLDLVHVDGTFDSWSRRWVSFRLFPVLSSYLSGITALQLSAHLTLLVIGQLLLALPGDNQMLVTSDPDCWCMGERAQIRTRQVCGTDFTAAVKQSRRDADWWNHRRVRAKRGFYFICLYSWCVRSAVFCKDVSVVVKVNVFFALCLFFQ